MRRVEAALRRVMGDCIAAENLFHVDGHRTVPEAQADGFSRLLREFREVRPRHFDDFNVGQQRSRQADQSRPETNPAGFAVALEQVILLERAHEAGHRALVQPDLAGDLGDTLMRRFRGKSAQDLHGVADGGHERVAARRLRRIVRACASLAARGCVLGLRHELVATVGMMMVDLPASAGDNCATVLRNAQHLENAVSARPNAACVSGPGGSIDGVVVHADVS